MKTCFKNNPGFINCSTHAVQALFNAIPRGEPKIGLDPLDPLKVPKIKVRNIIITYFIIRVIYCRESLSGVARRVVASFLSD